MTQVWGNGVYGDKTEIITIVMSVMCKSTYALYLSLKITVCQGETEENAAYRCCVHMAIADNYSVT